MSHASPATRNLALLLATALALATATALLRAEFLIAERGIGNDHALRNEEVVRRFYAAANAAIVTGGLDGFTAVVAEDVVLPPGLALDDTTASGRDALIDRFRALHAAQATLRVTVRDIVADEDDVLARVAIEGGGTGLPPARPLSQFGEDWLDGFDVRHGRIVAAWGDTVGLTLPSAVLSAMLAIPPRRSRSSA